MLFVDDLYEVQRVALNRARGEDGELVEGFAYFLEMGLGKTRLSFYEIYELFGKDFIDIAFIFCPKSLRTAWTDEAEDIEFPYPVLPFDGTVDQMWSRMKAAIKESGKCVVIIHYDIILTKGGDFIERCIMPNSDQIEKGETKLRAYATLDESTRIKNPKAKVGKYLIQTKDHYAYRRVLSGAPNPQGPHDLWGQLSWIGAITTNYYQFRNTYCKMGGFQMKKVIGAQNIDILEMRTRDSVMRAKKSDWTDLPPKLPPVIRQVEMTKEQQHAYKTMLYDFVTEWGDDEITAKMAITAKNKLQQIGSGFIYNDEGEPVYLFDGKKKNPKLEELITALEEIEGKAIVFYNFRPTMGIISDRLDEAGIGHLLFRSGLGDEDYSALKKEFNSDNDKKVAVCQIAAVKYGFTLLGDQDNNPCNNVLFFENSYDLEARVQGEDRAHRHGQRYPVGYTDIAISPEDRAVIKALIRKGGLQEAILSEFTIGK